jgi:Divergent InlB B-repeat domain
VVVSPNGQNVYVASMNDDAIGEFTRGSDGSLTEIGCIADASDSEGTSCSDNATATGLVDPQAIAISPNGANVYVAAEDRHGIGDIAVFTVGDGGTLTQLSADPCIAENIGQTPDGEASDCADQTGHGIQFPDALAVSGDNVYVGDAEGQAIAEFAVGTGGALSQPDGADDCIRDASVDDDTEDCSSTADGLSEVTGVVVSPGGANVYTSGAPNNGSNGSIAEFSVGEGGTLAQLSAPNNCLGDPEDDETCGGAVTGLIGTVGLVISPDGSNVYTASEGIAGPIAEFSRGAGGALAQLDPPNDCIQEQSGENLGCGTTTGAGIGNGFRLIVSPDGADVYAAAPSDSEGNPCDGDSCEDVAEFARDASTGALAQLASPDSCIQDASIEGTECPGNENGTGLGGPGLAISPDGNNVYVTGSDDIAEFGRGTHTLTVTLAGSGTGAASDGTISCTSTCSNAYPTDTTVTLTATPNSGSTFAGWSGSCSGTGTCQVTMNADTAVTATFSGGPAVPGPVLTGAPSAVTDNGAGFSGSVNPEGLPTTVYFQYGLDRRYSQVGASGPNYAAQTEPQPIGSDFSTHGVGPVTVTGLVPNAVYHVRLVATNSAGTTFGQDVAFTTSHGPAPGAPTLGKTFNIEPVSGLVLIDINGHLVPLTELTQIPAGVAIDTLHGTLKVITATGGGGSARDATAKPKTQSGEFSGAVFRLSQQARGTGRGLVTIMMALSAFKGAPSEAICRNNGAAGDAHAAKTNSKVIQLLHASAHGKFRTSGRYSAATVLGTIWTVSARCDGTLTHAIKDEVQVTDFVRHKTIILHAGQSYLAPRPTKHK